MQFNLILTSLLFFTTWRNLVQASNGSPNGCSCVTISKIRINHSNIEKHTIQEEGPCLFRAVVFHTVKRKTICFDPNDEWVKRVIRQLEKRRNEKISTRGTSPRSGPSSTSNPASLLGSEPTSDLTLAPSSKTSTSSTAPSSIPSSTTLTSVSTQSTPNPTSASNTTSGTSGITSANDRIPATSMKTRKAYTRGHQRTRKRLKRKNMKKWQRRCKNKSK